MTDTADHRQPHARSRPPRRRTRQAMKRRRTVRFDLSDEEFTELRAAADRAGLARGAFAAQAALFAARSGMAVADSPLREALGEFVRAAGLVRRIGVNLNQAVAKLNAPADTPTRRPDRGRHRPADCSAACRSSRRRPDCGRATICRTALVYGAACQPRQG